MDQTTWLLFQLADSGLPTGGFVSSSGLEAALQTGLTVDVNEFVRHSVDSYACASLPFVSAAWSLCDLYVSDCDSVERGTEELDRTLDKALERITDVDDIYEASTPNVVARRASMAQGGAMLTLYSKSFKRTGRNDDFSDDVGERTRQTTLGRLIDAFKSSTRSGHTSGHLPVSFGLLCGYLGLSLGLYPVISRLITARRLITRILSQNNRRRCFCSCLRGR